MSKLPFLEKRALACTIESAWKRMRNSFTLAAVLISLTAAAANLAGVPNAAEAQPVVGATTHPIQYWIGARRQW